MNIRRFGTASLNNKIILMLVLIFTIGIFSITSDDAFGAKTNNAPKISMKAKPSCGFCSKMKYRWYDRTFLNYCPHCHNYNTLRKNPKRVPEREYTCKKCGADYCGVCGHDKHGNRRIGSKYKLKIL